jgi:hypothetical protein
MGEKLWAPIFHVDQRFSTPRSFMRGVFVGWQPGVTVVHAGNPWILEEHIFGGYQVYVRLKDEFYSWNSNCYTLDWFLEDIYAIAPITGTHVSCGVVDVNVEAIKDFGGFFLIMSIGGAADFYRQDLPAAPSGYWLQLLP